MAEQNGQTSNTTENNVSWSPESFRALRDALKRPGLVTLHLWPEMPDLSVTLDMSGLGVLRLTGKIVNQILVDKKEAIKKIGDEVEEDKETTDPEKILKLMDAIREHDDYILGAVIVEPKYYMLDEIKRFPGGQPPDGLCILDFEQDMIRAIVRATELGNEELRKFRADPIGHATALAEQRARETAELLGIATGDTVVDQAGLRSSGVDDGEDVREGTAKRGRKRDKEREVIVTQ